MNGKIIGYFAAGFFIIYGLLSGHAVMMLPGGSFFVPFLFTLLFVGIGLTIIFITRHYEKKNVKTV